MAKLFQPAPPMRGVTDAERVNERSILVSTRAPHAGSDNGWYELTIEGGVSTRAPMRGATSSRTCPNRAIGFQPAPPMRGATNLPCLICGHPACLNPRPPMRGATAAPVSSPRSPRCFNPRPPCGERPRATVLRILIAPD